MGSKQESSLQVLQRQQEELLQDAMERLSAQRNDVQVEQWEQTWPDTSCGFGGLAGQAFTSAPTVVVQHRDTEETVVYHANNFAYHVHSPSDKFNEAMMAKQLPGQKDFSEEFDEVSEANG
jgi:hypothetical protein